MSVFYRIARASSAFGRLGKKVWERREISFLTKLKLYRAVVLLTLLHACETWTVYSRHAKQLNSFHMRSLQKLLHIKWQDKILDTKVLQRAEIESIHTFLKRSQLRWVEHVLRMPDERLPKRLLFGEPIEGKRFFGGQRKGYKGTLKAFLEHCSIYFDIWEEIF